PTEPAPAGRLSRAEYLGPYRQHTFPPGGDHRGPAKEGSHQHTAIHRHDRFRNASSVDQSTVRTLFHRDAGGRAESATLGRAAGGSECDWDSDSPCVFRAARSRRISAPTRTAWRPPGGPASGRRFRRRAGRAVLLGGDVSRTAPGNRGGRGAQREAEGAARITGPASPPPRQAPGVYRSDGRAYGHRGCRAQQTRGSYHIGSPGARGGDGDHQSDSWTGEPQQRLSSGKRSGDKNKQRRDTSVQTDATPTRSRSVVEAQGERASSGPSPGGVRNRSTSARQVDVDQERRRSGDFAASRTISPTEK